MMSGLELSAIWRAQKNVQRNRFAGEMQGAVGWEASA
jgi:hypothetical protein